MEPPGQAAAPAAEQQEQQPPLVADGLAEASQDVESLEAVRNRGKGQYGCTHYRRRVRFITPCCNEEWWCRHCHNKAKDTDEQDWQKKHELDRKAIQELVCALCETRQPVSARCTACGVDFGAYACLKCRFFDDDLAKQPYHCDECGICRIGGRDNYFHCSTCGSCYSMALKNNHQCVERAMHQNCPICFEFLFESVDPTTVLRCGHTIHTQCVRELEANPNAVCPTCPICKKSLGDYSRHWAELDRQVRALPVPPEYQGWRADILCNDCSHSSTVAFHLLGLKCSSCGSYNTRRMGLHTADGSPLEAAGRLGIPGAAGAGGANGAGPLAGLAPNLAQNLLEALFAGAPGEAGQLENGQEEEEEEDEEEWASGEDDAEDEEEGDEEWVTDDGEEEEEDSAVQPAAGSPAQQQLEQQGGPGEAGEAAGRAGLVAEDGAAAGDAT
ncbi:hypothetical protein ABPG77_003741 [Micractinium sp. CCAP 211/92]